MGHIFFWLFCGLLDEQNESKDKTTPHKQPDSSYHLVEGKTRSSVR
jgi:hypothetical protein